MHSTNFYNFQNKSTRSVMLTLSDEDLKILGEDGDPLPDYMKGISNNYFFPQVMSDDGNSLISWRQQNKRPKSSCYYSDTQIIYPYKKATQNESDGFFVWQLNPEGLESSFFDSCFLTCKSTQVIQFSTAYFTQFVYSDTFDER